METKTEVGLVVQAFPKTKRIRLKGKALLELVHKVYERDNGRCVVCGKALDFGYKPHHIRQAANKSDELDNMVMLCNECHYQVHHGEVRKYRELIKNYIEGVGNNETKKE